MIVYTVIMDDYDTLKDPRFIDEGCRYVCFTNTPKESDVWEIVHVDLKEVKDQRRLKIIGYQDFEDQHSVYIDASIEIKGSVYVFAQQWDYDLTLLQHRGRTCIYQEADAVLSLEKDNPQIVWSQMDRYVKDKFPKNSGMIQTGLLMRRRTEELDAFCDAWWAEVEKGSKRDQLSFNYVAWKQKKEYDIVPYTTFDQCFKLYGHKSEIS